MQAVKFIDFDYFNNDINIQLSMLKVYILSISSIKCSMHAVTHLSAANANNTALSSSFLNSTTDSSKCNRPSDPRSYLCNDLHPRNAPPAPCSKFLCPS